MSVILGRWASEELTAVGFLSAVLAAAAVTLLSALLSAQNENALNFPDGLVGGIPPWLWLRNSLDNEEDTRAGNDTKEEVYPSMPS